MALINEKSLRGPWSWMGSYVCPNGQTERTVDFKDLTRRSDPRELLLISFATLKDGRGSPSALRSALDLIANGDRIPDETINQPSLFAHLSESEKETALEASKEGTPINITALVPLVQKYTTSENYYVGASAAAALTRLAKFDGTAKELLDSLDFERQTKFVELGRLTQADALTRLYNFAIKRDQNGSKQPLDTGQAEIHLQVITGNSEASTVTISKLRGVPLDISFQNGSVDVGGFNKHYGYDCAEQALFENQKISSWFRFGAR